MHFQIQLIKLTGVKTGKEWYKHNVGNYYAVYAEPFADNDIYFGGTYLTYSGIGTFTSTRIHKENVDILTEPFSSEHLEEKQKELGIDIKHDYASETVFLLVACATEEVLDNRGVFKTYFAAHEHLEQDKDLCGEVYIKEAAFIG